MYTAYVQCTVFLALHLAWVSAIVWLVHVMALYRKYTVIAVIVTVILAAERLPQKPKTNINRDCILVHCAQYVQVYDVRINGLFSIVSCVPNWRSNWNKSDIYRGNFSNLTFQLAATTASQSHPFLACHFVHGVSTNNAMKNTSTFFSRTRCLNLHLDQL